MASFHPGVYQITFWNIRCNKKNSSNFRKNFPFESSFEKKNSPFQPILKNSSFKPVIQNFEGDFKSILGLFHAYVCLILSLLGLFRVPRPFSASFGPFKANLRGVKKKQIFYGRADHKGEGRGGAVSHLSHFGIIKHLKHRKYTNCHYFGAKSSKNR